MENRFWLDNIHCDKILSAVSIFMFSILETALEILLVILELLTLNIASLCHHLSHRTYAITLIIMSLRLSGLEQDFPVTVVSCNSPVAQMSDSYPIAFLTKADLTACRPRAPFEVARTTYLAFSACLMS